MTLDFDPVGELYARYPFPPAEPGARGWKQKLRRKTDEGREIASRLLKAHPPLANGLLLDAGCGTGLKLVGMGETLPNASLLGIDISQSSLAIARKVASEVQLKNVQLAWLNIAEGFPVDREASFDAVVCDGVLHHLKDPDAGLANLATILKPGGIGWITLFGKYGRADMGRLRKMVNILEPRFLYFDGRIQAARALLKATGLVPKKHLRRFEDEAFLADAALNPRETWFDYVTARLFFERAGLMMETWVDGERYWKDFVKAMKHASLPPDAVETPLSHTEKMRLVELWKGPGMLRFLVRKPLPEAEKA
jgi:SAM-dependent methyltransferase